MLSSFSYSLTVQVKDKQLSFKLTKEECQKLTVEHQPSDDVSYKPDRDVKGKPVKPATIEENKNIKIPKQIQVQLQMPLNKAIPIPGLINPTPTNKYQKFVYDESKINLGSFTIDDDGTIKYEGEPIKDDAQKNVQKICKQHFPD